MNKIAILNGPNLNLLKLRDKNIYGNISFLDLKNNVLEHSKKLKFDSYFFQSNSEGELVGYIQQCIIYEFDFIIINPAAYTHTSIAIRDALELTKIPFIEVHLSDIDNREEFRKINYLSDLANKIKTIKGKGINSYIDALDIIKDHSLN